MHSLNFEILSAYSLKIILEYFARFVVFTSPKDSKTLRVSLDCLIMQDFFGILIIVSSYI